MRQPHDSREPFLAPLTIYNLSQQGLIAQELNSPALPTMKGTGLELAANLSAISFHFISILRDCLSTGRSSLLRK